MYTVMLCTEHTEKKKQLRYRILNVILFQRNAEEDGEGRVHHGGCGEDKLIPLIQVEQHTSPSGVSVVA